MIVAVFRLAFVVACTGYVFGLVELGLHAGWPAGLGVAAGGLLAAVLFSEDWPQPEPTDEQPQRRRRHLAKPYGQEDRS